MTHTPDRRLLAGILSALRKARRPLTTRALADRFGVHSRRVSEALAELRKEGHRITLDGHGHTLVRGRRQIEPTIRVMRVRIAEMWAAVRGMERGHSRQTTAGALRKARAA